MVPKRSNIPKPAAKLRSERYVQGRLLLRSIKRILIQFRAHLDEQLRPQGLTTSQMQVLFAVRNSPGSSGAQIARSCYITPQTAQMLLRHLEQSGFILRGKDAVNDRIVTAIITAEGERLAESVEKDSRVLQRRLWKGISDAEMDGLSTLLDRCLSNLDGSDLPDVDLPQARALKRSRT